MEFKITKSKSKEELPPINKSTRSASIKILKVSSYKKLKIKT